MKDNRISITSLPPPVKGRRASSWNSTVPASPPSDGLSSSTAWCWGDWASSSHFHGSASTSTSWVWPAYRNSGNKGWSFVIFFWCLLNVICICLYQLNVFCVHNLISFFWSLISVIFILDSIRISFEAQNWDIMKEEDKIILVLIEYLRFWCDGASLKFRNMQMNWSFKVFITLNYG